MASITLESMKDVVVQKTDDTRATFLIEGLYPGFGVTLGNALRRVLYSSIPGAAITSVKIQGAAHEFSTISGMLEDVLELSLNLKGIAVRLHGSEPQVATINVKGEHEVTAKDIETPSQVEIVTKNVHIATLTSKSSHLEMELTIEPGMGYETVEARGTHKADIGTLPLDAVFSPVRKVNFSVQDMRVGDRTDYNRLSVEVETNGTISPEESFKAAVQVLLEHFSTIAGSLGEDTKEEDVEKGTGEAKAKKKEAKPSEEITKMPVAQLRVSARTLHVLEENSIKTVGGLLRKSAKDLSELEGMGDKAIEEVEKALKRIKFSLKDKEE